MAMKAFPIAAHAPTGAEPRHEGVPALGLHAQRHVIADGATIAIREDEKEHDRRYDNAQYEEGNENRSEYHSATSGNQALRRLPANSDPARTVPVQGSSS
jgi:hypothetical protein